MYPELFNLGTMTIHTYGVLAALGFLAAVATVIVLSRKAKLPAETMVDLAFWTVIIGFIGARVLFVLTRWDHFTQNPAEIFKVWEGGLVWYGGPLLAFPFGIWFVKKHSIDFWKAVDVAIPAMTVGHMLGRFGCFAAGCCYGKPTQSVFGVVFKSDLIDPPFRGIPLHPTQLYEGIALFVLYLGLLRVFFRKRFDGQVFLVYMIAYPVIRIIVEAFRGDAIRGYVIEGFLSTSQFISIGVVALGVWLLKRRLRALVLLMALCVGNLGWAYPVSFNDQDGKRITLPQEPLRVVTLAPSLAEWVAELLPEHLERIVGVSQFSDFPETLKDRPVVGAMNRINYESVKALRPDVVFATRDGNLREQIERLRELELQVVTVDSKSFEEIFISVKTIGKALQRESLAEMRINQMKAALERFRKRAAPGRTMVISVSEDPLIVVGGSNFISEAIETLGFENVFGDWSKRFPRISREEILQKKPNFSIRLSDFEGLSRPTFRILEAMSRVENAFKAK